MLVPGMICIAVVYLVFAIRILFVIKASCFVKGFAMVCLTALFAMLTAFLWG